MAVRTYGAGVLYCRGSVSDIWQAAMLRKALQLEMFFEGVVMRILAMAFSFAMAATSFGPAAAQTRGAKDPGVKTPSGPVRTVDILGSDDMKYSATTIAAKRGETLRIRLISKGTVPKIAMAHNVVVLKAATDVPKFVAAGAQDRATDFIAPAMAGAVIAKTAFAGPGETVEVTFKVPDRAGSYPFIRTFSGHYQAGMKGTVTVK